MAELKTRPTNESVADYLNAIPDKQRRDDCWTIAKLMQKAAKAEPKMWGSAIVGFGECNLVYASGRELDWPLAAFSPRKANLTLYLGCDFEHRATLALLKKLGKHTVSKACLYIKKLEDVHLPTLRKLIEESVKQARKRDGKKS